MGGIPGPGGIPIPKPTLADGTKLPSEDELSKMSPDEQQAWRDKLQATVTPGYSPAQKTPDITDLLQAYARRQQGSFLTGQGRGSTFLTGGQGLSAAAPPMATGTKTLLGR